MTIRILVSTVMAILMPAVPLASQTLHDARTEADLVGSVATEHSGPTRSYSSASSMDPLNLRGGAVATGLHGFYDYQSNGGSPEYIIVRPGEWNTIYTTFMNSLDGSTTGTITDSRRA